MSRCLTIAMLLLFASCGSPPGTYGDVFSEALPICSILAEPQKYDGRAVLVDTLYREELHGAILIGKSCSKTEVRLREASGFKENRRVQSILGILTRQRRFEPVEVVYRATFRVVHGFSCTDVTCFLYELEVSELVNVRRPRDSF